MESVERRVHPRIAAPVRAQILNSVGERRELPVRDISRGGLFVFTPRLPAPLGSLVTVELFVPNTTFVAQLQAEVVRSVEGEAGGLLGVGLQFAEQSPEQKSALDALLAKLLEGSGGERRAYPRISHRVELSGNGMAGVRVVLRDLSRGGAALWVSKPLTTEMPLHLSFPALAKGAPLKLSAKVVVTYPARSGEPYQLIGVQFDKPSPEQQKALDTYLSDLLRSGWLE
jgi:c-di-GMP-binding flagellar brake protein YcgR